MPVFHFIPAQNFEHNKKDFACPLYKAAERKGVLTTTCASSNYILETLTSTSRPARRPSTGCAWASRVAVHVGRLRLERAGAPPGCAVCFLPMPCYRTADGIGNKTFT